MGAIHQNYNFLHSCTNTFTHAYVHTRIGAIAVTSGLFSDDSQSPTVTGVQCTGSETDLLTCSHSNFIDRSSCGTGDDAGVVCQGSKITIRVASSNLHTV